MHKLATFLAVLVTVGTLSSYARDLDEGSVEEDGGGHTGPFQCEIRFIPRDARVYLKLYNPSSSTVSFEMARVRVAGPGDTAPTGVGSLEPTCSSYALAVDEPFHTLVSTGDEWSPSGLQLGVEMDPCEAILIEVNLDQPGVEHIVKIWVTSGSPLGLDASLFLEIWDGVCNEN